MMLVTLNRDVIAAFKANWLFLAIDLEILCNLFTEKCENKAFVNSMAGCVTFCFDGCFVKCFRHVSSVIIPFLRPISNLRNCYRTIRHNCENKIICC